MTVPNRFQKIVAQSYCNGEYAHLADLKNDDFKAGVSDVGDTLFQFLITELGDQESCEDFETARTRISTAIDQIMEVETALHPSAVSG